MVTHMLRKCRVIIASGPCCNITFCVYFVLPHLSTGIAVNGLLAVLFINCSDEHNGYVFILYFSCPDQCLHST